MRRSSMGSLHLTGADGNTWDDTMLEELICLRGQKYDDFLSDWIVNRVIRRFHHLIGRKFRVSKKATIGIEMQTRLTLAAPRPR